MKRSEAITILAKEIAAIDQIPWVGDYIASCESMATEILDLIEKEIGMSPPEYEWKCSVPDKCIRDSHLTRKWEPEDA